MSLKLHKKLSMPNILIAESLHLPTLTKLEKELNVVCHHSLDVIQGGGDGISLYYQPDIESNKLAEAVVPFDGLVVRPKEVSAETIQAGQKLQVIIRGGTGVNSIDVEAATAQGVKVLNTPGQNTVSTAEYTFGCLFQLLAKRPIAAANQDAWARASHPPEHYSGFELKGKKLAIFGFGNIGKEVAKRALAFDMEVVVYSRSLTEEQAKEYGIARVESFEALCKAHADAMTLHAPLTPETKGIVNEKEIALMKDGTILINTARPGLINKEALKWGLETGKIASFAIDGDDDEAGDPGAIINPFLDVDDGSKGILTPHIADCTDEAQANITYHVITQLVAFFRDGKVVNWVNG